MSRVAVVTGGGSGMGQAIAVQLAARRAPRRDPRCQCRRRREGSRRIYRLRAVRRWRSRVTSPTEAAVDSAFETVRKTFGPVEILVTSAAISGFTRFDKITLDEWNRYLAVNLTGTFLCMRSALSDMVAAQWGRIVTISSAAGQKARPGRAITRPPRAGSSP